MVVIENCKITIRFTIRKKTVRLNEGVKKLSQTSYTSEDLIIKQIFNYGDIQSE